MAKVEVAAPATEMNIKEVTKSRRLMSHRIKNIDENQKYLMKANWKKKGNKDHFLTTGQEKESKGEKKDKKLSSTSPKHRKATNRYIKWNIKMKIQYSRTGERGK